MKESVLEYVDYDLIYEVVYFIEVLGVLTVWIDLYYLKYSKIIQTFSRSKNSLNLPTVSSSFVHLVTFITYSW